MTGARGVEEVGEVAEGDEAVGEETEVEGNEGGGGEGVGSGEMGESMKLCVCVIKKTHGGPLGEGGSQELRKVCPLSFVRFVLKGTSSSDW